MGYTQTAYEYAKAHDWTPEQVRNATRAQVGVACGVDPDTIVDKSTFLVWNIKKQVARMLDADLAEIDREALKAQVKAFADANDLTVERVRAGETVEGPCIVVRRAE